MRKLKRNKTMINEIILPLVVMILWGSLFPFIKIGYKVFEINTNNIADILLFASIRFVVCGIIVCFVANFKKAKIEAPKIHNVLNICFMGAFAIVLHYGLLYVGLTMTDSSKTAILKQLGPLLFACFSFLFIKSERFSVFKILGALVGFGGIIAINVGAEFYGVSLGDILIISASVCTVISMIISSKNASLISPFWITGISQLFGGLFLLIIALIMGGKISKISLISIFVFLYICIASIIGYTLFYYVQRTAELSKLFIIKFAEPLFACLFGALLLGENILKIQYFVSFILISIGIILGNRKEKCC